MGKPETAEALRVLMLDDDPDDAALVQLSLAKAGKKRSVRWVQTRADLLRELADFAPHIVLSDYKMPSFDGLAALALVREKAPGTPFILVSGTIGEEKVAEALKSGVTDYVLKDRLDRLEHVLTRAVRESQERADRFAAEKALRESQTQLHQALKMEALGRLSGGVAHDFNNILTAITGYSELALSNPKLGEELRADIQEILNAALRAAALTKQLLAFSRRQIFAPKVLDLNHSLSGLARMLQRIIGEDIRLTITPAPDLLRVRADAAQLDQVLMNLVVNARDAMPKGGTLAVSTANVELSAAALRAHPDVRPGRYVMLSVADSGEGMAPETLALIFEPFFTTKSKDKGTGLGLATVYGIVKQSDGFISVDSSPGAGSTFRVYLPAVDGEVDAVSAPPAPRSLRGTETILLVDDDASVGLVARRILESHGYSVLEARNGDEALRLCAGAKTPPRLVLTDVVMSGLSGPELAARLKTLSPDCRALFISGYAEGGISDFAAMGDHFISKPFAADRLVMKVRQILDAPAPPASP